MHFRRAGTITLAAAVTGCGGQPVPAVDRHLPAVIATPPNDAALLRVPRAGGTAELLRANTLVARHGTAVNGLPMITRILGANLEDETVYATDNAGRLIAIDLKSQRSRTVPTAARQFTTTPDGTILGIDSAHHPVRLVHRSFTTYKVPVEKGTTLMRAPGDQILVTGNRPGTLQVLGTSGEVRHLPIPDGRVTPTWVGDLVAVTTDSGILFVDPSGKPPARNAPARFVKVKGKPTVTAFSPSGHRLYVARKSGGLVLLDRFNRKELKELKELPLPGIADGLRADRSGRWLIAHGVTGDSLWVVDVTRWAVAWRGTAPWAEDLPQVLDGRMLLIRRRSDLVAVDLADGDPSQRGVLAGGSGDLYIMLPWVPKTSSGSGLAAAQTSAPAVTPPAGQPGVPTSAPHTSIPTNAPASSPSANATASIPSPAGKLYLQVSSSQNVDWAQALAKQLKEGGFPAKVLEPKTSDESYRVVVGPYATKEEADAVGKRLGRPYFIITPGSGDT